MSYKNEYHLLAIVKASQSLTMDYEKDLIEYGSIEEIYETLHVDIYDITNQTTVAQVQCDDCGEEEMMERVHKTILEYETEEQ